MASIWANLRPVGQLDSFQITWADGQVLLQDGIPGKVANAVVEAIKNLVKVVCNIGTFAINLAGREWNRVVQWLNPPFLEEADLEIEVEVKLP